MSVCRIWSCISFSITFRVKMLGSSGQHWLLWWNAEWIFTGCIQLVHAAWKILPIKLHKASSYISRLSRIQHTETDWTMLMPDDPLSIHTLRVLQYYFLEDTWLQLFNTCNESTTKIRFLNSCTSWFFLAMPYPASARATAIYGCFDWSRSPRGFFITVYTVRGFCVACRKLIHFGGFKDFE